MFLKEFCLLLLITISVDASLPERLALATSKWGCGANQNGTIADAWTTLDCLFSQWYSSKYANETRNAMFFEADRKAEAVQKVRTTGEITTKGAATLLDAVASVGEPVGISDTFADLTSGFGRVVLQVFLSTRVSRVVGIEEGLERHQLAQRARQAALGLGPVIYAVGLDKCVYAQRLERMHGTSDWIKVSKGPVQGIAIKDDIIYGVGEDGKVYKQVLPDMSMASDWLLASRGSIDDVAIDGDTVYGAGTDRMVWKQTLSNMTKRTHWELAAKGTVFSITIMDGIMYAVGTGGTVWQQMLRNMSLSTQWTSVSQGVVESLTSFNGTLYGAAPDTRFWKLPIASRSNDSDWTLASKGSVIGGEVSHRGVAAMDSLIDDDLSAALTLLQGDVFEKVEQWRRASLIYFGNPSAGTAFMMQLGWTASAELLPGSLVMSYLAFPGCYPNLLLVGTINVTTTWRQAGATIKIFLVLPTPRVTQPAWLMSTSMIDEEILQAVPFNLHANDTSNISRSKWFQLGLKMWHHTSNTTLWRMAISVSSSLGLLLATESEVVPLKCLSAVIYKPMYGKVEKNAVHCAWDALVARARLQAYANNTDSETLVLRSMMKRIMEPNSADVQNRTLLWRAAGFHDEYTAEHIMKLLLDYKANPGSADNSGLRPIDCAIRRGHTSVTRILLSHGVNVTSRGRNGRQALHYAALHGHSAIAQLLMERGAVSDVRDAKGKQPVDLAAKSNAKLIQILSV